MDYSQSVLQSIMKAQIGASLDFPSKLLREELKWAQQCGCEQLELLSLMTGNQTLMSTGMFGTSKKLI